MRPAVEPPAVERLAVERPGLERPGLERPGLERPGLERALSVVGDRWSLMVVAALMDGDLRYGELADRLATSGGSIAPNVLAARLRSLEADRLISAEPYQERPRRFRYRLTADGLGLGAVLGSLDRWGARESVGTTAVHPVCGTELEWRPWCPTCQVVDDSSAPVWV